MNEQIDAYTKHVFEYLDDLHQSDVTNMWGSPAYLQKKFSMDVHTAQNYFFDWMDRDGFYIDSKQHPRKNPAGEILFKYDIEEYFGVEE
jgi:hypothetical protein